ncbi:hypothetical protein FRB95_010389 [Tulasnella sp. JGI-2019a]|nr:hypothetical protein FRB95_010389 [Tulasnella sp. JGI-2019a]
MLGLTLHKGQTCSIARKAVDPTPAEAAAAMVETAAAVEMAALPATADPTLVEATPLATVATAALLAAVAHSGSSSGNGRNDGKGSNVVMAAPTTVVDFTLVAAAAETVDLLAAVDPPATVDTFEHYARITTLFNTSL